MKEIIRVENLSKAYRIGLKQQSHDTLFGKMAHMLKAPFRNLKNLRSLTRFDGAEDPTVHWALKDINFTVHEGEVLGIIGHNGAGKSTLLKILSRVTEPTTGRITIHGRVGALLEVGTGFHPELTGRENIYMNGTILGMTKKEIDRKLDEIVDFSGVEKYIDTPVKFYSSGMKVRLGFAVAAHLDPEILIIDEVLAVGDVQFQKKCLGKMEAISKNRGRTLLFVSHDMTAIQAICTRVILLNNGIVEVDGDTIKGIKTYSRHLWLANLETRHRDAKVIFNKSINKEGISEINYDQYVRLKCQIENFKSSNFSLYLIIKNSLGEILIHERIDGLSIKGKINSKLFTFEIPPLWLRPGLYNYHFKVISSDLHDGNSRFVSEDYTLQVKGEVNGPKLLGLITPQIKFFSE